MGGSPLTPQDFSLLCHPNAQSRSKQKGANTSPLFGLAPWSALELRPRIALSSAKVSDSVADHY